MEKQDQLVKEVVLRMKDNGQLQEQVQAKQRIIEETEKLRLQLEEQQEVCNAMKEEVRVKEVYDEQDENRKRKFLLVKTKYDKDLKEANTMIQSLQDQLSHVAFDGTI